MTVNIEDLNNGNRKVKTFSLGIIEAQTILAYHKALKQKIIVRGNTIVDGYKRIEAAKVLGWKQIEVWRVE